MCRFIETIRVDDGKIANLPFHLQRIRDTRMQVWGVAESIDVETLAKSLAPIKGTAKLRFVYDATQVYEPSCTPYTKRVVRSLKVVEDEQIAYALKSEDRRRLNQLRNRRGDCDEILVVKNGHLTDTSYTNVAFYDGKQWVTPTTPRLPGTCRARLLASRRMVERDLTLDDLPHFQSIALINAMMDLGETVLPVASILW